MTSKTICCSVVFFLMCLMKAVHVKAQCEKPNVGENRILTPESDKPTYPDGSTATFTCSTGYQPVTPAASKTITCNGNTWTELKLQCTKRDCRPLPDFLNGKYSYSPEGAEATLFGATATAKCNRGYMLVGVNPTRRCRAEGWDGRDPTCQVVKCLNPPEIENGSPDELKDEYNYEDTVSYTCNAGYTFFGSAITCSENGTFVPSPPRCKKVSCEAPIVDNGYRIDGRPPYGYNSFIQFKCDQGFRMEGIDYLKCEENGWDHPAPLCLAVTQATTTTTTTTTKKTTTTRPSKPATEDEKDIVHPTKPPHNKGLTFGQKVGIGVGVTAVVVAGLLAVYFYKKRSSTHGYSGNVATKSEEAEL